MKITLVHNSYQQRGGEDAVVQQEADLLKSKGNHVDLYKISNSTVVGFIRKLRTSLESVFSVTSYFSFRAYLREHRPDVVHVHNFFPLLSPSIFYACHAESVPVVMTLHNFRIICPTALLMSNGLIIERSVTEGPWWALRQRVYKNSFIGTFFLCLMIWTHKIASTWRTKVDRLIVLSNFGRSRFIAAGIPIDKLVVKPNFVEAPVPSWNQREGFLFVGRLATEKGICVLLRASDELFPGNHPERETIRIAGDGPLMSQVIAKNDRGLTVLGACTSVVVQREMLASRALLIPSTWYEGFPMVLVEAYACGLPVIASRIGALAELVDDGVTGLLFEPGNASDMAQKMRWVLEHPEEMQRMALNARARYEERYTPEQNYVQLMAIYQDTIDAHNMNKPQK